MEVSIREEIAKVTRAGVCDDHLLDLQLVAIIVNDGSELFFVGRVEDVSLPKFLQVKRWRVIWVILEVEEDSGRIHGSGRFW